MIETEISNVLAQIRSMSTRIDTPQAADALPPSATVETSFGEIVRNAVNQVSAQQNVADAYIERFQAGDENTSIAEVVVQMQKASISFQAMTEARNRIIEAYREIMNMSV